jgi:hypothetical protein
LTHVKSLAVHIPQIGRYFSVSKISQLKEIVEGTMMAAESRQRPFQQDIILDFLFEWKVEA